VSDELDVRVSDAERDQAVAQLREHCLAGRLTLDEYAERLDEAYRARTSSDLVETMRELPQAAELDRPRRRAKFLTAVLFGSTIRRGRWRVPRRSVALVTFGDADIDLRQARTESAVVTLTAIVLFGNIDFYVPEGFEVDVGGLAVFGHRRDWGRDEPRPGTPLIRVRIFSLFGTSDVWRVPPGAKGGFRDLIKLVRRRQPELDAG
jgi:uncharacterized protein DUF1707